MAGRVVADMDHVVLVAAGVISGRTEVSRSVLTSGSINWLGLFVNKLAAVFVFTLVIRGVGNTLRNTVNLECVLNSWKVQGFRRVATFGNIGIIHGNAEGIVDRPNVNNCDRDMRHAVGSVGHSITTQEIVFLKTLCFSSGVLVELSEDAGDLVNPRVLHLELDVGSSLLKDHDWNMRVISLSNALEQLNIFGTFVCWKRLKSRLSTWTRRRSRRRTGTWRRTGSGAGSGRTGWDSSSIGRRRVIDPWWVRSSSIMADLESSNSTFSSELNCHRSNEFNIQGNVLQTGGARDGNLMSCRVHVGQSDLSTGRCREDIHRHRFVHGSIEGESKSSPRGARGSRVGIFALDDQNSPFITASVHETSHVSRSIAIPMRILGS